MGGYERQNNRIMHHMLYPRKNGRFKGVRIVDAIKDYITQTQINVVAGGEIKQADDGSASIGYVDLTISGEACTEQLEVSRRLESLIRIEVDED